MVHFSDEAAELRRRIVATLHVKSSRVPLYQRIVLWAAVLAALAVAALPVILR
jgi:hypothetical protein